jgi:hypothetical protein
MPLQDLVITGVEKSAQATDTSVADAADLLPL